MIYSPYMLKRYLWLVDLLNRTKGLTREQINSRWAASWLNEKKETQIPERTFHRHKDAVKELFDIDIICDRANGHIYRIANMEDAKGLQQWVLNAFSLNNMVQESQGLSDRILFEDIPSGLEFLTGIVTAMQENKVIEIEYCKFGGTPYSFELEPYCLKVSAQRWYVTGRNSRGNIRTYGLDRVANLHITDKTFSMPSDFDAKQYFAYCVGVTVGVDEPEIVEILVQDGQQNYVRSLPIHGSQVEKVREEDYSIFSYYVRPSEDFEMAVKKYGSSAIVLKPRWLREQMINEAKRLLEYYEDEDN